MSLSHQHLSAHLTNLLVKMELVFLTTGGVMVKWTVSITLMRQDLLAVVSVKAGLLFKNLSFNMISPFVTSAKTFCTHCFPTLLAKRLGISNFFSKKVVEQDKYQEENV